MPMVIAVTEQEVPARIESAAYFVVSEAVANATRHSGADHVRVTISHLANRLRVEVADDGRGGAGKGAGAGLQSLEDRVLSLDGTWAIESPANIGTVVTAEFPLVGTHAEAEVRP